MILWFCFGVLFGIPCGILIESALRQAFKWAGTEGLMLATRCDGCGRPFIANAWNQRTCVACEVAGFPDQSKDSGPDYSRMVKSFRLAHPPAAARPPRRSQIPRKGKTTQRLSK